MIKNSVIIFWNFWYGKTSIIENVLQDYNFEISETSIDDDEKTLKWFFKINLIDTNNYKDINKFDISKDFELFVEKQTDGYLHINKYFNINS